MDYGQYYLNTLINAAKNLGPILIVLLVGYIIFFKFSYIQIKSKTPEAPPKAPEKPENKEQIQIEDKTSKEEKKQSRPEAKPRPRPSREEMLFQYAAGEIYSLKDLKKRYHKLLKDHHPDKVASLDEHRKKLAEKKTKEINSAYEQLKKKVS